MSLSTQTAAPGVDVESLRADFPIIARTKAVPRLLGEVRDELAAALSADGWQVIAARRDEGTAGSSLCVYAGAYSQELRAGAQPKTAAPGECRGLLF